MIKWGHPPRNYTPNKYNDDGCINEQYIKYMEQEENRDTLEEERWEQKRDMQISNKEDK